MITRSNYEIWFLDYAEGKLNPSQQKMLFIFLDENADLKKELEGFENINIETPLSKSEIGEDLKKKKSWLLQKYSVDELVFNFCENNLSKEELREWNDLIKTMPQLVNLVQQEQKFILKPLVSEVFGEKVLLRREEVYNITLTNYSEYFILYTETKKLALYTAISFFLQTNPQLKAEFELVQKLILKSDTRIVFENKNELKKKSAPAGLDREKIVAYYMWRSIAAAACVILAVIFFYPNDNSLGTKTLAEIKDTSKSIKNNNAKNNVSPNKIIQKEAIQNNTNNVALNNKVVTIKNRNRKNEKVIEEKKIEEKIIENKNENKNFVENLNNNKKQDTLKPYVPIVNEKPEENLAKNKTVVKKNEQGLNPLQAVAAVINKKYYEEETPKTETASTFYAMKNVVKSVSSGNADIVKKEDKDYKEFGFKIGDFKFSRKKNKNRDNDN